jgi:hypothetical protein
MKGKSNETTKVATTKLNLPVISKEKLVEKRDNWVAKYKNPDGSHTERYKRLRYRWMNWVYPLFLIAIMAFNLLLMYRIFSDDADVGMATYEKASQYEDSLVIMENKLSGLNEQYDDAACNFYYTVKDICTSSDDEVLVRLFEEKFPTDDVFMEDLRSGIITINAMLDNHVDVKCQSEVLDALQELYQLNGDMETDVDKYNFYLTCYQFWASEYNDTFYGRYNGTLDLSKYVEAVIET